MSMEILRDRRGGRGRGFGGVGMERARKVQTIDKGVRYRVESLKENKSIEC